MKIITALATLMIAVSPPIMAQSFKVPTVTPIRAVHCATLLVSSASNVERESKGKPDEREQKRLSKNLYDAALMYITLYQDQTERGMITRDQVNKIKSEFFKIHVEIISAHSAMHETMAKEMSDCYLGVKK